MPKDPVSLPFLGPVPPALWDRLSEAVASGIESADMFNLLASTFREPGISGVNRFHVRLIPTVTDMDTGISFSLSSAQTFLLLNLDITFYGDTNPPLDFENQLIRTEVFARHNGRSLFSLPDGTPFGTGATATDQQRTVMTSLMKEFSYGMVGTSTDAVCWGRASIPIMTSVSGGTLEFGLNVHAAIVFAMQAECTLTALLRTFKS